MLNFVSITSNTISNPDTVANQLENHSLNSNNVLKVKLGTYHPQTDGQTEIVNLTLLDMLKSYVNDQQNAWKNPLPLPISPNWAALVWSASWLA